MRGGLRDNDRCGRRRTTFVVNAGVQQVWAYLDEIVILHDGALPWNVTARSAQNILEPRESWELSGQVPNVVFPSAAIPESVEADGTVLPGTRIFIYYGAADTCVGLAVATAGELLAACREP